MRSHCVIFAALLPVSGCNWLWPEVREDTGDVSWTGQVLDGPYDGENGSFTGGTFEVTDMAGLLLDEGEEPWDDEPGSWRILVPRDTPVAIHLAADGMLGAAWRSTTPSTDAWWYTGALFAYDAADWMPFFEQFDGTWVDLGPLDDHTCWFWGAPMEAEAWAGADLSLVDGEGRTVEVLRFGLDAQGLLVPADAGPVFHLFAFDLTPGDVRLQAETTDGRTLDETWPSRGGEVITAWFLALSEEQ